MDSNYEKKHNEYTSTISFRNAAGYDNTVTTGNIAFLDKVIHPLRLDNDRKDKITLVFGSAGGNFGAILLVHVTGDYYGGILIDYYSAHSTIRFSYSDGTYQFMYI